MKLTWLIDADQSFERSAEFQTLIRTRGYECRPVKFFPESKQPGDIVGAEHIPIDARVVFFGGPALMNHIQTNRRWKPGGWCTFANFCCETYYCYFGKYLLNEDYVMLPAAEAVRRSSQLFDQLAINGELFIRPAVGRKLFSGTCEYIDAFRSKLSNRLDPRTMVVISSPKTVVREWRLFVAHDDVITSSQYAVNGQLELRQGCPTDVLNFAETILSSVSWRPDPLFTMDFCESEGRIALVEINGFSCSNLYDADLNSIIDAVAEQARRS